VYAQKKLPTTPASRRRRRLLVVSGRLPQRCVGMTAAAFHRQRLCHHFARAKGTFGSQESRATTHTLFSSSRARRSQHWFQLHDTRARAGDCQWQLFASAHIYRDPLANTQVRRSQRFLRLEFCGKGEANPKDDLEGDCCFGKSRDSQYDAPYDKKISCPGAMGFMATTST
jgi:hypothetical protein